MRHATKWMLLAGIAWLGLLDSRADDKPAPKPTEQEIEKARADIKRQSEEVDKAAKHFFEARKKLAEAAERLDKLEGKTRRRWPAFGEERKPAAPPLTAAQKAELEKKLAKIAGELEEMRRDVRKPPPPKP